MSPHDSPWRRPGAVLLLSCYELGHQPLGIASPMAFLQQAGFAPAAIDTAVERLDPQAVLAARFVGIAVPMHTALRLGVRAAERVREINPSCHLAFYGLYAHLNADYLLGHVADAVIGGEFEAALLALVQTLEAGGSGNVAGVSGRNRPAAPVLDRLRFVVPSRVALPALAEYARALQAVQGPRPSEMAELVQLV